ncbi:MAG: BspA family leucine-rich repeat surface protein [Spirosomataceae bacterium]
MYKKHYFSLGALSPLRWLKSAASIFFWACLLLGSTTSPLLAQNAPFITRWDLSKPGASSTGLTIPMKATTGQQVSYTWTTVPVGTSGAGTFTSSGLILTGLPAGAIIDLSIAPTNLEFISMGAISVDSRRLMEIRQWGDVAWTSMESAFSGCSNMTLTATDVPNLAAVTNMSGMFANCSSFNQALPSSFNTSKVTNMSGMFTGCTAYNQALPAGFNTEAATDMSYMFTGCTAFNQPLPAGFKCKVTTNVSYMFANASAFNQNLAGVFIFPNGAINMEGLFDNCGLDVVYYTAVKADFVNNILDRRGTFGGTVGAAGMKFCANLFGLNGSLSNYETQSGEVEWGGYFLSFQGDEPSSVCADGIVSIVGSNPTTCGGTNGKIAFVTTTLTGAQTLSYKKDGNATTASINIANTSISGIGPTVVRGFFELRGLGEGIYSDFAIGATTPLGSQTLEAPICCPSGNTLYVNASVAGGTGDGSTWGNAYASLSNALRVAHACSGVKTIKVAAGTYKPTRKPFDSGAEITLDDYGDPVTNRDNTFHIPDGVTIEGGYNAATGNRDITANVTTLSGDFNGDDVVSGSGSTLSITGNTENAYHVVLASAASTGGVTIDGFSVIGGNADGSPTITVNGYSLDRSSGGGIVTVAGTNSISNNTLSGNNAFSGGGGIITSVGTNSISNNTLSRNTASNGGGIFTYFDTNTTLSNNTLSGNNAGGSGGGIFTGESTYTLSNNTLSGNNASNGGGGGISTFNGTNTISNNIFWDNKKNNNATVAGADYYADGTNGNTFKNNLLQLAVSNYTTTGSGNYDLGTAATGNLFAQNPLFVNAADLAGADGKHRTADDGLAIQANSPAFNTGLLAGAPTIDITGATRVGNPDIGAYEVLCTPPTAYAVTGTGAYCAGGTGVAVGLANSETGVTYQLKNASNANVGSPINGTTSSAINFGNQTAGTYTVVATKTSGGCTASMTGSAVVTENALPTISTSTSPAICAGVSSFTIPYTGTSASPTTYSISGTGITTVTDAALPASPITVNLSSGASGSSIAFTLTVKNANGCTSSNVMGSVTVNTVSLQAGTTTPTVCIGQSISLTASLVNPDTPGTPKTAPTNPVADSYAWAGPAGSGYTDNIQNPSVSASSLAFGGVYSVTVTSSGCTASATASVAVNNKPTLNAGSTTPSVCIGQSISLTAGAGASSYSWVGPVGTNYASDSQNPSVTASSLTYSGIYSVSASFNGCTASATTSISVKTLPSLQAGFTSPSTLCVGQSISLTAGLGTPNTAGTPSIMPGNEILDTYAWAGPAGSNFTSNSQNPTTIASSTAFGGTYSVTVTSNGCSASATTSLSVKPRPNLLAGPASPSVCVGQSISLTARLDAPGTPGTPSITTSNVSNDTYSWAGPSNFTSNSQNPTPFIASSTALGGTYSVTVTSNGCSASVTTSLTVITIPLASISPNTTQSICQGLPLSLQAAGVGPFAWTGPNGFALSTATATLNTNSTANSGVYRLTVGSGNCTASTSVSVNISPAALSVSPASLNVCLGQAINLTANASPAASALSWKGPAGFSSSAQSISTYATSTANLGVYSVSATIGSCVVTSTAEVKSGAILKAGVVGMPCVGGTIQFTASGMTSYTWSRPTNNFNSTLQNPVIPSSTLNDAGIYFLSARSGSCMASALVPVSLLGPGINPTFSVSPSSVTAGATVALSAASATGTYSWSGPNGFSGTTRTKSIPNFQTANNGVYRLTVTNGACSGYTEKTISINSATRLAAAENEPIEMEINAYPNPVTHTLTVEVRLKEPASLKLTLLNQLGQSSGQWLLNQETTLHKAELNLSSMQAGIYLLQAQTPTQQASKRIFKLE